MASTASHISVCICTYRRPALLSRLLGALVTQHSGGAFTYGVVVVDNDSMASAEATVRDFAARSALPVTYDIEPEQNIALARNRAVENATGDFIAFLDDDEVPGENWLLNLHRTREHFGADGVLGPVIPSYEVTPPTWVLRGRFYERPCHRTGDVLSWRSTRTGNVLLRRDIFATPDNMFRQEFGSGGEDRDFFKRMIAKGLRFVWCAEAPVYEAVTPVRCTRSFMVRRALLRGQLPHFRTVDTLRSLLAIPLYTASLPLLFIVAHHLFMKYLIKDCDHIGRLFALAGLPLIKDKYVVQ